MANRKSNAAVKVKTMMLDQAASLLGELPEKPKATVSLRQAIEVLQEDLRTALDKGYSYEEITGVLRDQSIDISPSTLKRYLAMSQSPDEKSGNSRRRRRRRKTQKSEPTESEA